VKDATSDMPGRKPAFGEVEGYRRFVADEVFPVIASHYRADMQHKIFVGHSYGSLFGTYVLLTSPEMFDGYVLGSPSLWYDDHLLVKREREYAETHKDLAARIYIGVGGFEGMAPKSNPHDPRYADSDEMVTDSKAFAKSLASHHYSHLHVQSEVIADEDHLTVAPILMTHGLLWTLGSAAEH
jgi:predicted alpha/beta superfamily hydrolase